MSCSKELEQLLPVNLAMPAIIDLLAKYNRVVTGCFSYELDPDYIKQMDHFIISVWELISVCKHKLSIKLSVTWKVHMVVSHVRAQLDKTGEGLAKDSEQTGEARNSKMSKEMQRFKMDEQNPHHGDRMLAGVRRFVSKRVL